MEKSQRGAGLAEAVERDAGSYLGRRREAGQLVEVCHFPLRDTAGRFMTQRVGAFSILPDGRTLSDVHASLLWEAGN